MAGYADTKKLIEDTLVGRPAGSLIYPEGHQEMAMSLLDYIHSVELLGASELQGIATTSTVPVQPDNAKVSYIATVPAGQTYVFTNFYDQNGNSISITTGANTVSLLTFLWNGEYWQVQNSQVQLMLNITAGYLYAGIAIPTTNPGSPDEPVFYIAVQAGTYTNFGDIVVNDGEVAILKYVDSSWVKEVSGLATREELSRLAQDLDNFDIQLNGSIIEDSILGSGTIYTKYIGSTTYAWTVASSRRCRLIPLAGYNSVKITANSSYQTTYTFLKDANLDGSAPVYATGWNNRLDTLGVGETSSQIDIPEDATLLYVYLGTGVLFQPSEVIGYGGRASDGIAPQLADLRSALTSVLSLIERGDEYNQYISSSSYAWTSASARHCLLIPITGFEAIQITANSAQYAQYTFLADANLAGTAPVYATGYGDTLINVSAGTTSDKIAVPGNATMLYIYYGSSQTFKPAQIIGYSIAATVAKEFDGKTIILLGDSQLGQALDVSTRIKNEVGGNVYNWGFGGCRMTIRPNTAEEYATWNPFSAVGVADALTTRNFTDMDAHVSDSGVPTYFAEHVAEMKSVNIGDGANVIMTIAYGGNDWNGGVLMGEQDSSNTQEFYGALNHVISTIMTAFPRITLLLVGMPYRVYSWSAKTPEGITSDSDTTTNTRGLYRYDYNDAIGEKAREMKVPFFDMYRRSGRNKYNVWTLCPSDGTHPTSDAGKQAEANLYVKILRTF